MQGRVRRQMQEKQHFSGTKAFVRVVIVSSCFGTILSIFCDLREIERRYCRLYNKDLSAEYTDYLWCSCCAQSSVEHFDHTSYFMRQSLICWSCCLVNCAVEEGDILGPDYMANFSPGWNSTRLAGLKFCCDYMTNFSPGWNISLGTKYEIAREESRENQAAILFPASQPGLKKISMETTIGFWEDLFQKPGWNFSPGWNSSCNQTSRKGWIFC